VISYLFPSFHARIEAEGDDLEGLLFHFLDELLFIFAAEPFLIGRKVVIESIDVEEFKINAVAYGEPFDLAKHPAGTEIKAITYSAMQIYQKKEGDATSKDDVEIYVIVDI
jgi:SHS2 domain-containing protein